MLRTGSIVFLAIAVCVALFVATTITADESGQKQGPIIQVDSKVVDLGSVWAGDQLHATFRIKNVGGDTLQIKDIEEKCDCTVAGDYPKTLEPGEAGELPFTLDTAKLPRKFERKVIVVTNDPTVPKYELKLRGEVKPLFEISPKSKQVRFVIPPGQFPKPKTFSISNAGPKPLELSIDPSSDYAKFDFQLAETQPGQKFEVRVSPKPPFKPGSKVGSVKLKTNTSSIKTISLRAVSTVLDRLDVQPKVLAILSGSKKSKAVVRPIRVKNYGKTPARVLEATVDDPDLEVQSIKEEKAGKSYVVYLKIPPKYSPPAKGRTLTIKTDDAQKPTLSVPIRRIARRKPRVRPAELMVGKPAPPFSIKMDDGGSLSNSVLGDAITVLNFVALNCPHCKKQMPKVESIRKDYERKGVRFVTVTQTMRKKYFSDEAALEQLGKLGITSNIVIDPGKDPEKPKNTIGPIFKATSYPTMVVLGKSGKIEAVNVGNKKNLEERMTAQLDALLAGKTPPNFAAGTGKAAKKPPAKS